MSGLAYEVWASRPVPSLEEVLRNDPDLRERAKALGVWTDLIARIEGETK